MQNFTPNTSEKIYSLVYKSNGQVFTTIVLNEPENFEYDTTKFKLVFVEERNYE